MRDQKSQRADQETNLRPLRSGRILAIAMKPYSVETITAEFRARFAAEDRSRLSTPCVRAFRAVILNYFRRHARSFPWRDTTDPYRIMVSEVMLQQTQTPRVAERFPAFLEKFPDIRALADAPLASVLAEWQGMGYNRRAAYLHRAAQVIRDVHGGTVPETAPELAELPGIGMATAEAITAYAYNHPAVYIETNIRTVFIHFFFSDVHDVRDSDILPLVSQTLPRRSARRWYAALMDYGVMIKKHFGNPGRRSAHHQKQSRFEGSHRQKRGRILKHLLSGEGGTAAAIASALDMEPELTTRILADLTREGLIRCDETFYRA